ATASISDRSDNPPRRKCLVIMASTAELRGSVRARRSGTFPFILTKSAEGGNEKVPRDSGRPGHGALQEESEQRADLLLGTPARRVRPSRRDKPGGSLPGGDLSDRSCCSRRHCRRRHSSRCCTARCTSGDGT